MSIKHSLLALLLEGPRYGAALRAAFEARTGGTWPLNVGQVYTTLGRLERDGLVCSSESDDDDPTISYDLTTAGRSEITHWWGSPVDRTSTSRDELAIKLALAVSVPGVNVSALIQSQRRATITRLQQLTRLKRSFTTSTSSDLAWLLVLEHLIFTAEAETRWLDHIEPLIARSAEAANPPTASGATP